MVLLGDEAQVESRFGLFEDSISVGAGRCGSTGYARYAPAYPMILETITVYTCIFFEKIEKTLTRRTSERSPSPSNQRPLARMQRDRVPLVDEA
jgi:hypothetical protein